MAQEIELKLSVPEAHASRVWEVLAHHPHPRPVTHELFSAYYDTPDSRLRRSGVALRLRRDGRRWIQTVKGGGQAVGGLHQRIEHDTEVAAQLLSFPALIDAGLGELIAESSVRDAITVVFTTEFSRTSTWLQLASGDSVEVSIDRGAVVSGQKRAPICEIELELKSGSPRCLFDLALEIVNALPARLDNRSKAQRGYALAAGLEPMPAKAPPMGLRPDMTVDDAFVALAFECLSHLQANETGLLEGRDPEYLHQARVALRRLRSVFRVFGAAIPMAAFASLLAELKTLGQTLGAARDRDVFTTEVLAGAAQGATTHPGIAELQRNAESMRRRSGRTARTAVESPEYTGLLIRLAAALNARAWAGSETPRTGAELPLGEFATAVLKRQHARVLKRGHQLEQLALPELHRLRIEVKRLRYAEEFFAPLAPKKTRDSLRALAGLQDLLGRINDDAGAWRILDGLAAENAAPEYQQALGYVRGWTARDAEHCRAQLSDAWAQFKEARTWW